MSEPPLVTGRAVTFDEAAHRRFADVSGDWNEIHIDPVAARRAISGEMVVHGVHVVLRALDELSSAAPAHIERVRALFRKPVFPGDEVTIESGAGSSGSVLLEVRANAATLVSIEVDTKPEAAETMGLRTGDRHEVELRSVPRCLSIDEIGGMAGSVAVPEDRGALAGLFPNLVTSMGPAYVAQLMAVSRLIGMECPGRYSMLSAFDLATTLAGDPTSIEWSVTRADQRVGAVRVELAGGLVTGHVDSFVRPRPVEQPGFAALGAEIDTGLFAGQRALIVGGSRGLGALTAKLIATGGGEVVATWHRGREEADQLVTEIEGGGGRARAIQLDVASPKGAITGLAEEGWRPTHLYYFASSRIFARRTRPFEEELLSDFVAMYVTGFANVVGALDDGDAEPLVAFYPSSVAVDEPIEALTEYSIAKAAGEQAARTLAGNLAWLEVVVERLPRVPTDQTATLMPVEEADPVFLMASLLRRMA